MKVILKSVCLFVLLSQGSIRVVSGFPFYDKNDTDAYLTSLQIISKYGYPAESHMVQTEDGYILQLHRIPYGKTAKRTATKGPPVFLQHGIMGSSADFVLLGPNKALSFLLADQGYDVWLGNMRGNTYSRAHVSLTPEDNEFWDFSWHEAALQDLPAEIDFICNHTKQEQIIYVGHSMGTTMYLVLASKRPEYQAKVRVAIFFAAVAYMNNTQGPIPYLAPLSTSKQELYELLGARELFQQNIFYQYFLRFTCTVHPIERKFCRDIIFMYAGSDPDQFNEDLLPSIFNHIPAGASVKCFMHFGQLVLSGRFREFDYGPKQNMIKYRSKMPPDYNLEAIQTPIYIYQGENDFLSTKEDAMKLSKRLPNLKNLIVIKHPHFSHIDFILGNDAKRLLYNKAIKVIKIYSHHLKNKP